jgi:uncharacterized protein (DUF2126 family)
LHAARRAGARPIFSFHRDGRARTALCVEPRDGRLYIFLPPLTHLEHYVDVSRIEATAGAGHAGHNRGYEPPRDSPMRLSITPDPGVIEVNASDLDGPTSQLTTILYEEAHRRRLGTGSSCSTAATPAPAAAITSPSAGRPGRQPGPRR